MNDELLEDYYFILFGKHKDRTMTEIPVNSACVYCSYNPYHFTYFKYIAVTTLTPNLNRIIVILFKMAISIFAG